MNSEVFRFMSVRPIQLAKSDRVGPLIKLKFDEDLSEILIKNLQATRKKGDLVSMLDFAKKYINPDPVVPYPLFIGSKAALHFFDEGDRYFNLASIVRDKGLDNVNTYFKDSYDEIFGNSVNNNFLAIRSRVGASLVAAAIDKSVSSKVKSLITYLVYTIYLIERVLSPEGVPDASVDDFIILLPEGIFPLPTINPSLETQRLAESKRIKEAKAAKSKAVLEWAGQLEANKNAIKEVLGTFDINTIPIHIERRSDAPLSANRTLGIAFQNLSPETQNVLSYYKIGGPEVDIALATSVIEKANMALADNIYKDASQSKMMIKIGTTLIPGDIYNPPTVFTEDPIPLRFPGLCPPAAIEPFDQAASIPDDKKPGQVSEPYTADLMVVEQNLKRYELGEVAHVENVLKSEFKERKFSTSTTTEQSTLTETEVTDEKTKDLTTTDRYELQTEAQNVINENTSVEAGVTVNASYGPSVDITANANYANNTSTQDSHKASTTFARDTTTRAVSRLEKRTLTRKFTRTVEVVEEVNKHGFDNKLGPGNISGVYRWIDKIYDAQIVNYGKRLMFEFIVPEPAAFLRYAMTKQPMEGVTLVKPDVPGYCLADGRTFQQLKVQDIQPENYLNWVSKYGVEDVSTPPKSNVILSQSISASGQEIIKLSNDTMLNTKSAIIEIPDGYIPNSVSIVADFLEDSDGHGNSLYNYISIILDHSKITDLSNTTPVHILRYGNWKEIAIAVNVINKLYYTVIIDTFCICSVSKFQEWQLTTFNSIMNAYNDKKSRYDNAIEAAKIRAGYNQIQGKNPFINRETEKTELKKGCISILTGQRFDLFGAMNRNVAPYGYPEIDFIDANAEGRFISFFEQSFEWTNMTYVFYPYFWGLKDEWVTTSQLDDTDPLFAKFLQAGSARVQVPVRPGFGTAVQNYRTLRGIWNSDGKHVPTDENGEPDLMQLSIIAELKELTGNNSKDGKGTITVINGSTTVTGIDTDFKNADDINSDVNRRIIIKGKTYIIKAVRSPTVVVLRSPYTRSENDDTADDTLPYALGGILIGQSWEIKLPTSLVKIDDSFESRIQ